MRFRTILAIFLSAACPRPSLGQEEPPSDASDFEEVMTYYYIDKDVAKLIQSLEWLENSKMLDDHESAVTPTAAFLAVVFQENPSKVTSMAGSAAFTGKAKEAVATALWLSGNAEKIAEIFDEVPGFAKSDHASLRKWPIKQPSDLDMMWGAFLASGDTVYVKKVIDALDKNNPLSGDDEKDTATRKAAAWSLESNMREHELVYRAISKEAKKRKGAAKKKLEKMLASVKPSGALPEKDGDFSAMLVIMDEKSMKEFKKRSDEPLKLGHKSSAKRGDVVGMKIVFTGIELTEDLMADVDYDIKIVDPVGKLYEETDLKCMTALSGKVPTRFRIFDNQEVVMIRFEPTDPLGIYKITATIRDKVGSKSVPLHAEITVTDKRRTRGKS